MGDRTNIIGNEEIYRAYYQHSIPDNGCFTGQLDLPVATSACGATIYTADGREIIDFASGHFGHNHPKILSRVTEQFDALALSSRVFFNRQLADFVAKLADMTAEKLEVVYPCNSESEAIDGALKLARGFHYPKRYRIVAVDGVNAFSTLGSLSVSRAIRFRPRQETPVKVTFIPYGDHDKAAAAIDQSIAAVIVEPTGIFSGSATFDTAYLRLLARHCQESGALLISDETNTGLGHSGMLFVSDSVPILPDILVLGRTLGGGLLPMAAYVAKRAINDKVYGKRNPALHGSTTGGNPAACVAATAVLEILEQQGLPEKPAELSNQITASLSHLQNRFREEILEYRVQGLIGRINFSDEQKAVAVRNIGMDGGILCDFKKSLRSGGQLFLQPPLAISPAEMANGLQALEKSCEMALSA